MDVFISVLYTKFNTLPDMYGRHTALLASSMPPKMGILGFFKYHNRAIVTILL